LLLLLLLLFCGRAILFHDAGGTSYERYSFWRDLYSKTTAFTDVRQKKLSVTFFYNSHEGPFIELHTLSGNKSLILTPKRHNDHSRHFYITGESPLAHDVGFKQAGELIESFFIREHN